MAGWILLSSDGWAINRLNLRIPRNGLPEASPPVGIAVGRPEDARDAAEDAHRRDDAGEARYRRPARTARTARRAPMRAASRGPLHPLAGWRCSHPAQPRTPRPAASTPDSPCPRRPRSRSRATPSDLRRPVGPAAPPFAFPRHPVGPAAPPTSANAGFSAKIWLKMRRSREGPLPGRRGGGRRASTLSTASARRAHSAPSRCRVAPSQ